MSSYFDALSREVSEAADRFGFEDTEQFLAEVVAIEERMYQDVVLVTGDREFPDDLREKILGVLATVAVYQPGRVPMPSRARELVTRTRYSRAIEDVHDLFHEVARRRIETRFGILSDNPPSILALRDEHDGG